MQLSQFGCTTRRERLIDQVEADLIVISNPRHVQYLSGYWSTPLHIGTWGTPTLIIDAANARTTLLTHDFAPGTDDAYVDEVREWPYYGSHTTSAPPLFSTALDALREALPALDGRRVAIEFGVFPYGIALENPIDVTPTLLAMRRHKYDDELGLLRLAVEAVEAGHKAARAAMQPGIRELEIYNLFNAAVTARVGEPVLPLGDFASGERVFSGGGPPTDRVLEAGDAMIIDAFPVIRGYRADFTATTVVGETLSEEQARLEAGLHAALQAGERQLRPGVAAKDVYAAVRAGLEEHGLAEHFPHHAGHGLGLGHPEAPYFVPESTDTLVVGDVVTLEPGAYGPNFGGRIEHNYRITENGTERLTNHDTAFLRG